MKRRSFDYDEEILTQINERIKKGVESGEETQQGVPFHVTNPFKEDL